MIDIGSDMLPNVRRYGGRIEDLPSDARFDVIICSHVMEHLLNPLDVLNSTLAIFELPQAAKCLKLRRGGKLEGVWTNERRILTPRYFSCAL